MNLEGSVIIITGSATGLGAAVAKRSASKGARVVVNYTKSETEAQETASACRELGVDWAASDGWQSKMTADRGLLTTSGYRFIVRGIHCVTCLRQSAY